jgi:tetratricopeptide (TPR) repeat protein
MLRDLRLTLFCMTVLASCDAEAPAGPAPSTSVEAPSSNAPASVPMALAMADPGGTTPVDTEVKHAQSWVLRMPRSTDKLVLLGRAWVKKARHSADPGYYLHAKAAADLAFEIDPESSLAFELLAQVLLNNHEFEEARSVAERVLAKDDESLLGLAVKTDALYELGRIDEAVKTADRMVQMKPDLASYCRVSFFQWLRGDVEAALGTIKAAIVSGNDPANPEPRAYALVQAAGYFFHMGDYEGADEGYKQALAGFPDYPPALVGRGRVALAKGDARQAAELLRTAYRASPLAETAWRLGDALSAAGDTAGAEEAYASVVRVGRGSDPRTLAAFLATTNRDPDEALELAEAEMKLRPSPYSEDVLAWALYRKGRYEDAKVASDRANALGTRDATLLYHAGAIRIALGDTQKGKELVERALALSPSFDPAAAKEARALVEALDK